MKKLSEGRKMFVSVMVIFAIYAVIFIVFEDYDRRWIEPFNEVSDWHLLGFSLVVLIGLGVLLHRYARRMDERISREQAEKENRMRRELTQNIAHELKTPVASILGFTETILDNPAMTEDTRRQFIEKSHAQAERLTALLQDISTLNRMDYAADVLTKERVDISALFADIAGETALALHRKQMTLRNCLQQGIIVEGNLSLIYSIFRNLMDNAINYAGQGTTIEVSAHDAGSHWQFTFADNGAGIAQEHLPRIFERFYRIDKGRSRSLGGTGLGLAIVKNAVQLHGGTIIAHETSGGGLTFEFNINKLNSLVRRLLCMMLIWTVGTGCLCAQEIVEHQGNHYTIHADALEPDAEMTLLDVLQICPEFMTTDGKSITADYVLTIDDISVGVNWEGMLQNIKAVELDEVHIYNYSTVANGDDGLSGEINITFKDAEQCDAKIALAGSTYGNGRMFASYAESGEKVSVRGMLNTELRYGKGKINDGMRVTSRRGVESATVFLNWQPTERDNLEFKLVQGYLDQANRFFTDGESEKDVTRERLGEFSATYERKLNDRGAYLYLEGGLDYMNMTENQLDVHTWAPIWNIETGFPLFTDHLTVTAGWEIDYINSRTKTIAREQYLYNDLYLQFDYALGPWILTVGDRLRLIGFWDKYEANSQNGEEQWSHHRNDHALHASVGYKSGRHFLQGNLARNFYTPSISDFFHMEEQTNLRLYTTDIENNLVWQVEARYAYQTPKLFASASLLHQWKEDGTAGNEQVTGISASVTWLHGPLRLTAGADYYHQHVDEGTYSDGFNDNYYHLKLAPMLTLPAGWRLSSQLLYSSRKKQYDEHPWLYASLKVNKDLGRYCNVFADFHDIAGSPTALASDLNGYFKNRALTIGVTIYPFR